MKTYAPPKLRQIVTEAVFRRGRVVLFTVLIVLTAVGWGMSWWYWAYLQNIADAFRMSFHGPTHYWSLAVEEQFYLIWPFLVLFWPRRWLGGGTYSRPDLCAWLVAQMEVFLRAFMVCICVVPGHRNPTQVHCEICIRRVIDTVRTKNAFAVASTRSI